jgi:hypothetical protein|tara:strand:- start:861 stop:1019 length:159 start_codon:yes stop_codon:yes gene_type:complete
MEPLIIHIFDEETQNYEYDDLENSWFIVKHGNGKVDIKIKLKEEKQNRLYIK